MHRKVHNRRKHDYRQGQSRMPRTSTRESFPILFSILLVFNPYWIYSFQLCFCSSCQCLFSSCLCSPRMCFASLCCRFLFALLQKWNFHNNVFSKLNLRSIERSSFSVSFVFFCHPSRISWLLPSFLALLQVIWYLLFFSFSSQARAASSLFALRFSVLN